MSEEPATIKKHVDIVAFSELSVYIYIYIYGKMDRHLPQTISHAAANYLR